jgi:hypothetical protein
MNCLYPLKHWGWGFQSHSRHGSLCLFCVVVMCVGNGLATGWSPFKESYRLKPKKVRYWKKNGQGPTKDCRAIIICTPISRNCHVRSRSQNNVTTDGQPASMSWCQIQSGTCDQILFSVWKLLFCLCGAPSLTRGRICLLLVTVNIV